MMISEKIALCRKALGISQEELAALLNISRQAVSRWETGAAMPDTEKIIQLSRVFCVSTDYLLLDEVTQTEHKEVEKQPETQSAEQAEHAAGVEPLWTMDQFMKMRVKERRRKFRMAGWILFLVFGWVLLILSFVFAHQWGMKTDWWYTDLGRFGTGLFHTGNLAVFIGGLVLMIPGVAGLIFEYRRED